MTTRFAYLARALRTSPKEPRLRQYVASLFRDRLWYLTLTELGHRAKLRDASFSPDGKRVVTACFDNTARIWDANSGQQVGEPLRHKAAVNAANFSADGTRIVTASDDNTAQIWDANSGQQVGKPLRHDGEVRAANFSPDGARIVTASLDKTARIWDAKSGQPIGEPLRHDGQVNDASFSADDARIVTACGDNTARIWDAKSGEPMGKPLKAILNQSVRLDLARTAHRLLQHQMTVRRKSGTRKAANRWANRCSIRPRFIRPVSARTARVS